MTQSLSCRRHGVLQAFTPSVLSVDNIDSTLELLKNTAFFRRQTKSSWHFSSPEPFVCIDQRINWNWWRMTGSNRRPPACKAGALPAELIPQYSCLSNCLDHCHSKLVGLVGFEPTTPALSRRCSNRLSYRPTHSSCGAWRLSRQLGCS